METEMSKYILRIVDQRGEGLYRNLYQEAIGFHDKENHPSPCGDSAIMEHFHSEMGLKDVIHLFNFAFGSPEQMICWIHTQTSGGASSMNMVVRLGFLMCRP